MSLEFFPSSKLRYEISPSAKYYARNIGRGESSSENRSLFEQNVNDELLETMVQRTEDGSRTFNNIDYPVTVLASQIFHPNKDVEGNQTWTSRLYLAGEHQKNGMRNPRPWHSEGETIGFARVTSSVRDNAVTAILIERGEDYSRAVNDYNLLKNNPEMIQRVATIYQHVDALRENRRRQESEKLIPVFEYTEAAD